MVVLSLILGKSMFISLFLRNQWLVFICRKKSAELRTSYVHDKAHIETNIGSDASGPTLNGAVVLGHQGWLGGYQYVYSTAKAGLTKNNFALGYKAKDFTLFANLYVLILKSECFIFL